MLYLVTIFIDIATINIPFHPPISGLKPFEAPCDMIAPISFDAVLEFVAKNSLPNSSIAFDYAIRSFIEGDYSTYGAKKLADTWEKMGEPGLSGIEDGATDRFLRERGLSIISDFGPDKLEQIFATS